MSANHPLSESSATTLRQRRHRLLVHAALFSVAGLVCLASATSSSSAAPTVQDNRFLPATTLKVDYTCQGNDRQTTTVLGALGLASFGLPVSVSNLAVAPSPSPGDVFDMSFTWRFELSESLVNKAIQAGNSALVVNGVTTMAVDSGADGADVVGDPPAQTVELGDGTVQVVYEEGPFTGPFTRTAAVDEPITFAPKTITATVATDLLPLNIICTVDDPTAVLSVSDTDGEPPVATTLGIPEVVTTIAAPATTAAVAAASEEQLPVTGSSSNLYLVLLALALIDVGYLALSSGRTRSGRVSSVG